MILGPSGGFPGVAMVQSSDFWDGPDLRGGQELGFSTERRVFPETEMRTVRIVVLDVAREDTLQVPLAQHDHVIGALPADATCPSGKRV